VPHDPNKLPAREALPPIGTLAAGVAHELRNPLTAMKARCFALRELLEPGSPAFRQAEVIERELDRLERILRDFLEFSRPSEPEHETVPLGSFLAELADLLRPDLEANGLRLVLDQPEPTATARFDPGQIKQVLINLVRNAIEVSEPDHGEIGISCAAAEGDFRISVADNGPGISPEVHAKLFTPFFSRKPGGTGLGLSIARNIARRHGGDLTFDSEEGRGSVFHLTLPGA